MNATMFAPRNVRERKKLKSTIGARRRRSIDDEAGEADDGDGEQRELARGAPVPGVALDEREHSAARPTVRVSTPGTSTVARDGLIARLAHREQRDDDRARPRPAR